MNFHPKKIRKIRKNKFLKDRKRFILKNISEPIHENPLIKNGIRKDLYKKLMNRMKLRMDAIIMEIKIYCILRTIERYFKGMESVEAQQFFEQTNDKVVPCFFIQ